MNRLRICLLGEFEVRFGSQPAVLRLPKKAIGLLAYLAARPGQARSRVKLAEMLWDYGSSEQSRHSLRQALLTLRRALDPSSRDWLRAAGESLALEATRVHVDVVDFERLAAKASLQCLEAAASLYRGEFLEGLYLDEAAFHEWLVAERERLREIAMGSLARLLQLQRQSVAAEPAIQTALRLLKLDRTQEVVHRTLIRLYAGQGRRAEALRQYRTCVEMLRRELGVEPEPETVRLSTELTQRRADPRRATPPVSRGV